MKWFQSSRMTLPSTSISDELSIDGESVVVQVMESSLLEELWSWRSFLGCSRFIRLFFELHHNWMLRSGPNSRKGIRSVFITSKLSRVSLPRSEIFCPLSIPSALKRGKVIRSRTEVIQSLLHWVPPSPNSLIPNGEKGEELCGVQHHFMEFLGQTIKLNNCIFQRYLEPFSKSFHSLTAASRDGLFINYFLPPLSLYY